jgi:hypothetical protein
MVTFPFPRNAWHSFASFVEFEKELLDRRRSDKALDLDLTQNREPWIKLRNEEIYPVHYFCLHSGLPQSTQFRMTAPGAFADVEIRSASDAPIRPMQITTAGPIWPDGRRDWGLEHRLHMEQLKTKGWSMGWGPYRRETDGSISNREIALDSSERDPAYKAGLEKALRGKELNQHADCELIVYANGYPGKIDLEDFVEIASSSLQAVPLLKFSAVHIVGHTEGYLVSTRS